MIYSPGDLLLASSRGIKGEQPLHVPSHGHQAPLASDPIETAQQELPEAEHRFDDAEHRLRRLLAQGIELLAVWCHQPVRHGLDRRGVLWSGRHRSKTRSEERRV